MTHHVHPSSFEEVVHTLAEQGFDGMAQAMQVLINECMRMERQQALGVAPFERSEARRGQANGFKSKRVKTRIGELELAVPQVRGAKFYPSALERGVRSEKALKLALAEMYVQGVSTRKVKAVTEALCGHSFSASSISGINKSLDAGLRAFAERRLSEPFPYLILVLGTRRCARPGLLSARPCSSPWRSMAKAGARACPREGGGAGGRARQPGEPVELARFSVGAEEARPHRR